jgi:hypothetical protein
LGNEQEQEERCDLSFPSRCFRHGPLLRKLNAMRLGTCEIQKCLGLRRTTPAKMWICLYMCSGVGPFAGTDLTAGTASSTHHSPPHCQLTNSNSRSQHLFSLSVFAYLSRISRLGTEPTTEQLLMTTTTKLVRRYKSALSPYVVSSSC